MRTRAAWVAAVLLALVISSAAVVRAAPGPDSGAPGSNVTNGLIPTLPPVPTLPPILPTLPPVLPTLPPVLPTLPPVLPTLPPILPTLPPAIPTLPPLFPTPSPGPNSTPTPSPSGGSAGGIDEPSSASTSPAPSGALEEDEGAAAQLARASTTPTTPEPGQAVASDPGPFDGIVLPVLVLGVPLLIALAILIAQLLGGAALLPVVRRTLGSLGVRRWAERPSSAPDPPAATK